MACNPKSFEPSCKSSLRGSLASRLPRTCTHQCSKLNFRMASVKDSFVDVERYRLQLEENVAKLRASLKHWRTWEADYECMKEELPHLGKDRTSVDMVGRKSNSVVCFVLLTNFILDGHWQRLRV